MNSVDLAAARRRHLRVKVVVGLLATCAPCPVLFLIDAPYGKAVAIFAGIVVALLAGCLQLQFWPERRLAVWRSAGMRAMLAANPELQPADNLAVRATEHRIEPSYGLVTRLASIGHVAEARSMFSSLSPASTPRREFSRQFAAASIQLNDGEAVDLAAIKVAAAAIEEEPARRAVRSDVGNLALGLGLRGDISMAEARKEIQAVNATLDYPLRQRLEVLLIGKFPGLLTVLITAFIWGFNAIMK